jgi:hypothetical protein
MSENLTSKAFSEHLRTMFQVLLPGAEALPVELVEVEEQKSSPQVEQFSLIFRGPQTPVRPQKIYKLQHEKLGTFELFLVPLGPDKEGMLYQSCFNLLRKAGRSNPE